MQKIFIFFLCIYLHSRIFSQESTKTKVVVLDTVVITGTKTERLLLDVPVRTEIVSKETLAKHHAKNLKDALENLPGLYFSSSHGKEGAVVAMQGFDENRVLVLIDGNRVVSNTGTAVDLSQIAVTNVERIEVVKGATSALHGSDAMGGVINVITKKTDDTVSLTVGADIGSYLNHSRNKHFDTQHIYESFIIQNKRIGFSLSSDYRNDEGFDFDQSNIDSNGDELEQFNLFTKLSFTPKAQIEFGLDLNFFEENKNRVYTTFVPGLGATKNEYSEHLTKFQYGANLKYLFDSGSQFKTKLLYEDFADETIEDIASSPQIDKGRNADVSLFGGDFQYDWMIRENLLFLLGISPLYERMSQSQFANGIKSTSEIIEIKPGSSKRNYAIYLQGDWTATNWMEILPGLRYQYDSDFGDFMAPKLNISFKLKKEVLLRLGYGVGYRVPNLKERYYFFDHSSLGYQVVGNPDLQPEKSHSLQLGLDIRFENSLHFDFNLFYNRIQNLIDTQLEPGETQVMGGQVFSYQNINRARTGGAEIAVDGEISKYLKANAGYVYLDAKDEDTGNWLARRSRHQIKAGLIFGVEEWGSELLLNWSYYSKQHLDIQNSEISPGWNVLDIKFNQKISNSFNAFIGIKNAFDVHREPNPSQSGDLRPANGRYIYAGFKYEFNLKRSKDEEKN